VTLITSFRLFYLFTLVSSTVTTCPVLYNVTINKVVDGQEGWPGGRQHNKAELNAVDLTRKVSSAESATNKGYIAGDG
jgi:hypothetical protein